MKQHITCEQFNELSKFNKSKWFDWSMKSEYARKTKDDWSGGINTVVESVMEIPNIGQMIEFLDEHKVHYLKALECEWPNYDCDYDKFFKAKDICDALWEAVKEVLK